VYLDKSLGPIAATITESSQRLASTLGVHPDIVLYSFVACIILAVPFAMAHYGWSRRGSVSPYSSSLGAGGVPNVTDEDYSYITSQDLQDSFPESSTTPRYAPRPRPTAPAPEDDVILINYKGATYPAHFPPYSIGDGKLRVRDIRDRIALELDLSDRRARRAKILYKARQLKEPAAPIRDYGVKNNSEVLVVLPEGAADEGDDLSGEEMVVVDAPPRDADDARKRRKRKSKKSKKTHHPNDMATSPHDSASSFSVLSRDSDASPSSPSLRHPVSGPMAKLNEIETYFVTKLYPLCEAFIREPPADKKKREDDHRRITETVMQHIILKLDEVEMNGDQEAKRWRKDIIMKVQRILKELDTRLNG
ncbi:hypothetical protein SODALDRAFT_286362, partial [Sodiomyces alkalinus F11]